MTSVLLLASRKRPCRQGRPTTTEMQGKKEREVSSKSASRAELDSEHTPTIARSSGERKRQKEGNSDDETEEGQPRRSSTPATDH